MSRALLRRLGLCAAALALLTGCSTSDGPMDAITSLNPFKKEAAPPNPNAKPILEASDPAAGIVNGRAKIGPAIPRSDWPQAGGSTQNDSGNVAGSLKGQHFWSMKAGASSFGKEYLGVSGSKGIRISARPVAADGVLYMLDSAGIVSGYKVANSGGTWHVSVFPQGETKPVTGGGLAVAGNRVFVATGYGDVLALDTATSNIVWRGKLDAPARSAPAVGGGKVVVVSQAGTVTAFDQTTGASSWTASSDASGAALLGAMSPAVTADTVVVPGATGQILALDLATGAQKWQASIVGNSAISAVSGLRDASASPVVHDGTVYATGVGGSLVAVSLKTGDTLWQQPIGSADTPVVSGDSLFLVDLNGRMIAVATKTGKVTWAQKLPDSPASRARGSWVGPVMAGGQLWAASNDGRIAAVDATTGALGTTTNIGFGGGIAPILASGKMMILGGDGMLVAVN